MSHLPNWQEYGLPVAQGSANTVVEAHDKQYGTYQHPEPPKALNKPPTQFDPKPFAGLK